MTLRRPFPRARRVAKWTALAASAGLLILWALSARYMVVSAFYSDEKGARAAMLGEGAVTYLSSTVSDGEQVVWYWWGRAHRFYWRPVYAPGRNNLKVGIPLWIPLVVVALPTGWLFWSGRRARQ